MQHDLLRDDGHAQDRVLEQRLVELETRLAFQEHAMSELSQALADARIEGARNAELLRHLLSDLGKLRNSLHVDAQDEPPPPHY